MSGITFFFQKSLWCIWMKQFRNVIHLFQKFENFSRKMTCLDEEIKRKLRLMNFKNVIQITKIVKFEIRSKRRKLKIL